jgi:hypothetical protein
MGLNRRDDSGPQIRNDTKLQRNPLFGEVIYKGRIFDRASAMTDTINPERAYGSPHALWSTCFSRVSGCPEAEGTRSVVHLSERCRGVTMFRTSDADPRTRVLLFPNQHHQNQS